MMTSRSGAEIAHTVLSQAHADLKNQILILTRLQLKNSNNSVLNSALQDAYIKLDSHSTQLIELDRELQHNN